MLAIIAAMSAQVLRVKSASLRQVAVLVLQGIKKSSVTRGSVIQTIDQVS